MTALVLLNAQTGAQTFHWASSESVTVCPAAKGQTQAPDFTGPSCELGAVQDIDPQGKSIWIKTAISVPAELVDSGQVLGLYVSAKAASDAYLQGHLIGRNGRPADSRASEIPGRMDAVFTIPPGLVRTGYNEVVLRMSGRHGFLHLEVPVHGIGIGEYADPTNGILRRYWPSLITFGVFIAGALYFGVAVFRGADRFGSLLLCLVSLFAAGQLIVEVSRGLFAYEYPFHDLRLVLIVLFSAGFGLCLSAHVVTRFIDRRQLVVFAGIVLTMIVAISFSAGGFDGKAAYAVLVPTLASLCCAGIGAWRRKADAGLYLAALLLFAAVILATQGQFLDVVFYYAVAGLLMFLFARQAIALAREQEWREAEADRTRRLQQALDQVREKEVPQQIKIKNGSTLEVLSSDRVAQCNGAGDYVELCFFDGGTVLHSGSLNELEASLPDTFLRVHRSHIVNTAFVKSLERRPSGNGQLVMATGSTVPVSRRIMPKVRRSLG